ncbi:Ig-like domain-containing protein [Streptomyces collinus]|uniref:Ig-like domain-containing protein n=1 Tax=Streptomyces collinus TaxID=42684 RepID=UPI003805DE86
MRKRTLTAVAVSGALFVGMSGPTVATGQANPAGEGATQQAPKPPKPPPPRDVTKNCLEVDTTNWADCSNATFQLLPGERISVRVAAASEVVDAAFQLVEARDTEEVISEVESVGKKRWQTLLNNVSKFTERRVTLLASPMETFDDGETIKAQIRVEHIPLNAFSTTYDIPKNKAFTVRVTDELVWGKHPIKITRVSKPKHGTEKHLSDVIRYTPAKNFTGEDSLRYEVQSRYGERDSATITFVVK